MPPTGRTKPERVISPVIATSASTGIPRAADTIAVAIVTPADGPSLGMAPAGTWMCRSCFDRKSGGIPSSVARCRMWLRAARADSCITLPKLAGQHEVAVARHQRRFDEEHVAAGLGPRDTGRHARPRGPECGLRSEARRPQERVDLTRVDDGGVFRF